MDRKQKRQIMIAALLGGQISRHATSIDLSTAVDENNKVNLKQLIKNAAEWVDLIEAQEGE